VPDSIMLRMQQPDSPEAARAEGVAIAREMIATAKDMVQGVQVSALFGRYAVVADVLVDVLTSASNAAQSRVEGATVGKL
jgi:hypothetical protein